MNRRVSDAVFTFWACPACEMTFLHPQPQDLGRYYAGGYQAIPASMDSFTRMADAQRGRLQPLLRHKTSGRLLEIGSWIGLFSHNAQRAGFEVDVIEMDAQASAFMRERLGLRVETTDDVPGALEKSSTRYDVIAMWHSLEHFPAPWEVIARAAARLAPGGVLLIAIPNIAGGQARRLGAHWMHLDAPRHTCFWSPQGLVRLAASQGLGLLELSTDDALSRELETMAWMHRIRSLVRVPLLRGALAIPLAPLLTRLSSRQGGAGLTAVFQAPGTPVAPSGHP